MGNMLYNTPPIHHLVFILLISSQTKKRRLQAIIGNQDYYRHQIYIHTVYQYIKTFINPSGHFYMATGKFYHFETRRPTMHCPAEYRLAECCLLEYCPIECYMARYFSGGITQQSIAQLGVTQRSIALMSVTQRDLTQQGINQ